MPPRKAASLAKQAAPSAQAPITPEIFYNELKETMQRAEKADPLGLKLVDRSRRSMFFSHMSVPRQGRPAFVMTKRFFSCFLDVSLVEATFVLKVTISVMRKLRAWCGVTRWPRSDAVYRKVVYKERMKMMEEVQGKDPYAYEMLYHVHELAGYKTASMPKPLIAEVVTKVRLPTFEEQMVTVENFIHSTVAPLVERAATPPVPVASRPAPREPEEEQKDQAEEPGEDKTPFQAWDQELGGYLGHWDDPVDGPDYGTMMM